MNLDIVILAAGQGTRMKSELPKVLHPVAGRPMVAEVVATAREVAAQNIVVVVGHGAEQVKAVVGHNVTFALQAEQLGTGHAVLQAHPALTNSNADTVLVLYGDSPLITADTLRRALVSHQDQKATITLLSFLPADPTGYGRIVRAADGRVMSIVEQRDATDAQKQIRESNSGFMIFEAAWLWHHLAKLGRSPKGEYYLTDTTAMAVIQGRTVQAIPIEEREVLGVNDRVQLAAASAVLWQKRRDHWMREGVTLVDPSTVWIEADVTIGRDTVIYPNVYLKGNTTIGANCTIGAFSIMENATVAEGSDVSPHSHLSD
jgi:bifunctional UDP-N-acetylglucosamine pyrophosphorylase / glucosamine-1-phosphate N-acetyltransferase